MKNSTISVRPELAELQARQVIRKIQKWAKQQYPSVASTKTERLIVECLIEITVEKKLLAAR